MTPESVHAGAEIEEHRDGLCIPSVCTRYARSLAEGGSGWLASISFRIG
jgi:hypothetical protein